MIAEVIVSVVSTKCWHLSRCSIQHRFLCGTHHDGLHRFVICNPANSFTPLVTLIFTATILIRWICFYRVIADHCLDWNWILPKNIFFKFEDLEVVNLQSASAHQSSSSSLTAYFLIFDSFNKQYVTFNYRRAQKTMLGQAWTINCPGNFRLI